MTLDENDCLAILRVIRWPNKPICPYCSSTKCCTIPKHRFHCNSCNTAFSVTAQTIFHQTRLPLAKWFEAISFVLTSSKYVSSRSLAIRIGVNKHTGYRVLQQIDRALIDPSQRVLIHQIHFLSNGGQDV